MMELEKGNLNGIGLMLLNVKLSMLENHNNSFIKEGLLNTLNKDVMDKEIYKKLIDHKVKEKGFYNALLKNDLYTNQIGLLNHYRELISTRLENDGAKYFTTEITDDNQILIIRKFGISLSKFQHSLHVTSSEAKDLIFSGFFKQYCELKLRAFSKEIMKELPKKFGVHSQFTFEITPTYYNEERFTYTVDFNIHLKIAEKELKSEEQLSVSNRYFVNNSKQLLAIFNYVNKKYEDFNF